METWTRAPYWEHQKLFRPNSILQLLESHTCSNIQHPCIILSPKSLGRVGLLPYLVLTHWQIGCAPSSTNSVQNWDRMWAGSGRNYWALLKSVVKTSLQPTHQGLSSGLGGELSWGCCSCKTSETKLKWSRKKGERERKVALIVAELSGACVFPWWVIYWCLSGMNRSKAAGWQAINHTSNQGWQSSNKTENKENQLLPVPPPEKNNFSVQSDSALSLPCAGLIKRHL